MAWSGRRNRGLGDGCGRVDRLQTSALELNRCDRLPRQREYHQEFISTATLYLHPIPGPVHAVRKSPPARTRAELSAAINAAGGIPNQSSDHQRRPPPPWSVWRRLYGRQHGRRVLLNHQTASNNDDRNGSWEKTSRYSVIFYPRSHFSDTCSVFFLFHVVFVLFDFIRNLFNIFFCWLCFIIHALPAFPSIPRWNTKSKAKWYVKHNPI